VSSDGLGDVSHVAGFASSTVQDLEDEARRVRGPDTPPSITTIENLDLPFRVPRDDDPSVWSVTVKVPTGVLLSTRTVLTDD
jgi:hypothetical protein